MPRSRILLRPGICGEHRSARTAFCVWSIRLDFPVNILVLVKRNADQVTKGLKNWARFGPLKTNAVMVFLR